MCCNTKPGPAAALRFLNFATGERINQSDWYAIKKMAAADYDRSPSRRRLTPQEARDVVSSLADSIARQEKFGNADDPEAREPWGYMDAEDVEMLDDRSRYFNASVEALMSTLENAPLTDGSAMVLRELAVWSPRRAAARAKAMLDGPPTFTPAPPEVNEVATEVTRMADDIWFESANWQHDDGDEVALGDMRDGGIAGNNCYNAALYVDDAINDDGLVPDGWDASTVETLHIDPDGGEGSGVHWANVLTSPDGDRWVIDYTARQFGGDVPYPLIAPMDEWLTHVDRRTKAIYNSDLQEVNLHRAGDTERIK